MVIEQVFINNGETYKVLNTFDSPADDPYIHINDGDPVSGFYKLVGGNKKCYTSTAALRNFLNVQSNYPVADLSDVDVCPIITMPALFSYTENTNQTELYFRVDNSSFLQPIADYYNLMYPVTQDIAYLIDNDPAKISYYTNGKEEVVLGSVKFVDKKPTMFKIYVIYKDHGQWRLVNRGRVFKEDKVVEEGGWYFNGTESKYESSNSTSNTVYVPGNHEDPLANWEAHITYTNGSTDIRYYESSKMARTAICNLTSGSNYEEFDKAPQVSWWLGRSYYKKSSEQELYFHVDSKDMLDQVCEYYNLPVPYDADLESILLYNKEYIRFKSYDLLQLGEGNFVEVVVASVTFDDNTPISIKLYETIRPYK